MTDPTAELIARVRGLLDHNDLEYAPSERDDFAALCDTVERLQQRVAELEGAMEQIEALTPDITGWAISEALSIARRVLD